MAHVLDCSPHGVMAQVLDCSPHGVMGTTVL